MPTVSSTPEPTTAGTPSSIRLATVTDVPAIIALERQAHAAAHWSDETYCHLFSASSPHRLALVMETGNRLLAFVVIRIVSYEWEIENLAVASNMLRQGNASRLLRAVIDSAQAQHAKKILLEVRDSNLPARALYAKAGFLQCGRRTHYYQNPEEDAICYALEVTANS